MADPRDEEEVHVSGEEARAGATPRMTRYVLGFSLVLVIAVFLLIWLVWR